jgi:hypothetical protein
MIRDLNPKLFKPALHISLSFAPINTLKKGFLPEIAEQGAQKYLHYFDPILEARNSIAFKSGIFTE